MRLTPNLPPSVPRILRRPAAVALGTFALAALAVGALVWAAPALADDHDHSHSHPMADGASPTTMPGALNRSMMEGFDVPVVSAEGGDFSRNYRTTCNPVFERYPVAGPHNNGYDANWHSWNCNTAHSNSDYYPWHLGNDIFGAEGTPIVAAQSGTISYSFWDNTGGKVVYVVDDCGWWHYYAHLKDVDPGLYLGQYVEAGTRLGTLGRTGNAAGTEPHLHYSVYPGTFANGVDPHPYLLGVQNGSCQSGNACSCLYGINVDNFAVGVPDTDCGHRVCGLANELFTCSGSNWSKIGAAGSCNGSCSCPGGKFKNGRDIPAHMTHCGFRVCGMNSKYWDCTSSGWSNTGLNCS
ncbi:MAG: M23 family metallopeptidase [Acidobacteriota bacterium]